MLVGSEADSDQRHVPGSSEAYGILQLGQPGVARTESPTTRRRRLSEFRRGGLGLQSDVWQLYDTRADFSLANDLAAKQPGRLAQMQALFMKEAQKHHVLPIDDRLFERALAAAVGRPDLMAGRTSLTLAEGMAGMMENVHQHEEQV
jgi:hypothetical protein